MKIPSFLKNKFVIIGVILVATIFGYCQLNFSKTSAPTYTTETATKGTLISTLTASGSVAATNSRTVTTTASGVVKKVFVKEGQKVSTGTPILQIDLDLDGLQKLQQAYSSYQSAKNSLASAKNKLLDLQSTQVATKNVFDNQWANQSPNDPTYIQKHNDYLSAQFSLDQQQQIIAQLQSSLESSRLAYQMASSTVYAPISGTVSAISLAQGMILNPTSNASTSSNQSNKIAIVKTNTTPAISVSLTEIDVPKVHVGDKVTITLDAFPGKTYAGKVIAIDTSGTVSSNVVSYTTTIQLDSDVPEILSNMSATAKIITQVKEDVILINSAAVKTTNGQSTVQIMKNGLSSTVDVVIGGSSDTQTEIVSGISEGDVVIDSVKAASAMTKTSTSVFGGSNRGFGGAVFRGN